MTSPRKPSATLTKGEKEFVAAAHRGLDLIRERVNGPVRKPSAVYQRDNSFYSTYGRGGRWHFMGDDLRSACGTVRMLNDDQPRDASDVAVACRCRAKGCAEKWPKDRP